TSAPGDGSRTITLTPTSSDEAASRSSSPPPAGSLRLRGAKRKPRVAWSEDTVDNEGCGRKSSKICCIYHKPKRFDESSDEDSSSDDDGGARPIHRHSRHCNHDDSEAQKSGDDGSTVYEEHSEPNAYEADPSKKGKGRA
ncbi:hypothetical protein BDZ89DRAFT_922657, partial [Hymenopellis radicata]